MPTGNPPTVDPKTDKLLRRAIREKRLIRLLYHDKVRIMEPHDYGIHKGKLKLLGFQVAGQSSGKLPNWRWVELASASQLTVLDDTFPGGRPQESGKHHQWDELFARVEPAPAHAYAAGR